MIPGMRKRRVILLAVAVIAVLGGAILWETIRPPAVPDPVYAGHPLSFWLDPTAAGNASVAAANFQLFQQSLDSNAVPYLVHALKTHHVGTLRTAYDRLYGHFPAWLKLHMPDPNEAALVRNQSCAYLSDEKSAARPAIPELIRELQGVDYPAIRASAAGALGNIANRADKPVVQALLLVTTKETDPLLRGNAVWALANIANSEDKQVVEALVAMATNDPDYKFRPVAGAALRHINPEEAAKAGVTNVATWVAWPANNSAGAVR